MCFLFSRCLLQLHRSRVKIDFSSPRFSFRFLQMRVLLCFILFKKFAFLELFSFKSPTSDIHDDPVSLSCLNLFYFTSAGNGKVEDHHNTFGGVFLLLLIFIFFLLCITLRNNRRRDWGIRTWFIFLSFALHMAFQLAAIFGGTQKKFFFVFYGTEVRESRERKKGKSHVFLLVPFLAIFSTFSLHIYGQPFSWRTGNGRTKARKEGRRK